MHWSPFPKDRAKTGLQHDNAMIGACSIRAPPWLDLQPRRHAAGAFAAQESMPLRAEGIDLAQRADSRPLGAVLPEWGDERADSVADVAREARAVDALVAGATGQARSQFHDASG